MPVTWTTKLQPLGSVTHISMSSTTRVILKLKWTAWLNVSVKSSASTPETVCYATLVNLSSLCRDLCVTNCSLHSKTSTSFIIICSQADNESKLACENVAKMDIGGEKKFLNYQNLSLCSILQLHPYNTPSSCSWPIDWSQNSTHSTWLP